MRILTTAKGIVSVDSWSNNVRIDGKSLSEQLAAALNSNSVGDNSFASVTVEMLIQEPKEFTTSINGEIFIPEEKTTETEETV